MSIKTFSANVAGVVRNFNLPKTKPLVPLIEAIVNSINAIDERKSFDKSFSDGKISIKVLRSEDEPLKLVDVNQNVIKNEPDVIGFEISDNGCGFTDENMSSFMEVGSMHKSSTGGKGVGRFSWLKAFNRVEVISVYKDLRMDRMMERSFQFTISSTQINEQIKEYKGNTQHTTVKLLDYKNNWRNGVPRSCVSISNYIVDNCLVYFIRKYCPTIVLQDDKTGEIINLNELFQRNFNIEGGKETIEINNNKFDIQNVKVNNKSKLSNLLYLCGNDRLVDSIVLEKYIPDLNREFCKKYGYQYLCVVNSAYLDAHVDMNRLTFNFPEGDTLDPDDITRDQITKRIMSYIKKKLAVYIAPISKEKYDFIKDYIIKEAPQYRPLLRHRKSEIDKIEPGLTKGKLDDYLHNIYQDYQRKLNESADKIIKKFINNNNTNFLDYGLEEEYKKTLSDITEANEAALAGYVIHRKFVIKLLEIGLKRNEDGKYFKEKFIHNLIFPMGKTGDDIPYKSHNLWLVDERLAYYDYIASDKVYDDDKQRPDLLCLDRPVAVAERQEGKTGYDCIVIIELKRPMRDDYNEKDNPIDQVLSYVETIKDGKGKTVDGRIIKVTDTTPFYLYAICDDTESLRRIARRRNFTQTPDNYGYFNYYNNYHAYFEIITFEKLLQDAKKHNKAFFDYLDIR